MKVKSYKKKLLIICLIFSFNLNIFPALISGTLVNTPNGLTSVEKLCVGDNVIGYCTKCKNFVSSPIIKIKKISVKKICSIKINNEQLFATKFHLFFDPNKNKWIKAKDLTRKNCLMSYSFNKNNVKLSKVRCNNSKKIKKRLIVYEIGLKYPHTYFVSNSNILTHNFAFTLGATVAYGLGAISLESIAIGAAAIGLGICTFFGRKSKHTHVLFNPCNQNHSPNKKPDDEKNKKNKERKTNTMTKTETYDNLKENFGYENYKNGTLKRKPGHEGLGKDAEFLDWDGAHNDLEAYRTPKRHKGSIEPGTWKFYKPPIPGRKLFK